MNAASLREETIRCFARKVSEIKDESTLRDLYHFVRKTNARDLLKGNAIRRDDENEKFESLLEKMA